MVKRKATKSLDELLREGEAVCVLNRTSTEHSNQELATPTFSTAKRLQPEVTTINCIRSSALAETANGVYATGEVARTSEVVVTTEVAVARTVARTDDVAIARDVAATGEVAATDEGTITGTEVVTKDAATNWFWDLLSQ